jgi:hypothetical protein
MSDAVQRFLRSFKALPQNDQHDVLVSLLRLPIEADYSVPTDAEFEAAADAVFLELEKAERSQ